ncbi:MAG: ribosome-associated translation inhibitor RaiA [Desulfovibrionaceae bacterium]|jgi:putative sigma-54 modulation protein|nr:ribosome-associated translation inhibitor RaiA [Desulfovibrionaceae bacterium]
MNITFNFKNFEPSDHLKEYATSRFEKISKYISDSDTAEIQVNLSVEKFRQMADIVFVQDNVHLSAYQESEDMYATIDMVLDKLEAQVKKIRERMKEKKRKAQKEKSVRYDILSLGMGDGGTRIPTIEKSDNLPVKPMNIDEAAMQLDNLNYEFLVFRNSETDRVNVIYKRKNDDYGLIDPGV